MDRAQLKSTGRLSAPALVNLVHEMLDIRITESEGRMVVKAMASAQNALAEVIDINDFDRAINEDKRSPSQSSGASDVENSEMSDVEAARRALELIAAELHNMNVPLSAIFAAFDTDGDKQIDRAEFIEGLEVLGLLDWVGDDLDAVCAFLDDGSGGIRYGLFVAYFGERCVSACLGERCFVLLLTGCCGCVHVALRDGIAAAVDELLELSTSNVAPPELEVADKLIQTTETEKMASPKSLPKVVVVVGARGVGKSAIVRRLAGQDIHALHTADITEDNRAQESCTECTRANGLKLRIHELPSIGEVPASREMGVSCGTTDAGEVEEGRTTMKPARLPEYLRRKPEEGGIRIDALLWVCNSSLNEDEGDGQNDAGVLHTLLSGPDRVFLDGVPLLCVANKVDISSSTSDNQSHADRETLLSKPSEEVSIAAEKRLGFLHMLPQRCWRLFRVSALSGEGLSAAFGWLERFLAEPLRESSCWFAGEINRLSSDITILQRALVDAEAARARKADVASKKEKAVVAGRMSDLAEQLENARSYYGKKVRKVDDQRRAEKAKASRLEARCHALEGALQEKDRCNSDLRLTIEELQRALVASQDREDAATAALHGSGVDEIDQAWRDVNQCDSTISFGEQTTTKTGQAMGARAAGNQNNPSARHSVQGELDTVMLANRRRTRASRGEQGRGGRERRDAGTAKGLEDTVSARAAHDLELAAAFRQRHARSLALHHQQPHQAHLWAPGQSPVPSTVGVWNPGVGASGSAGYNAVLGAPAVAEALWRAERNQRRHAAHTQEVQ